jgi:hypothetical protein
MNTIGTPRKTSPKNGTPRRTPAKKERTPKKEKKLRNDQGEEGIQGTLPLMQCSLVALLHSGGSLCALYGGFNYPVLSKSKSHHSILSLFSLVHPP